MRALAAGILLGLLTCLAGLFASGAGHGWTSALWFSPLGLVAYPLVLHRRAGRRTDRAIVVGALVLDAALAVATWREGGHYVRASGAAAVLWLACWFGWQTLALANAVRRPLAAA